MKEKQEKMSTTYSSWSQL